MILVWASPFNVKYARSSQKKSRGLIYLVFYLAFWRGFILVKRYT